MNELSMYILDLVQNSFVANAKNVEIVINETSTDNRMELIISDDGDGMDKEFLKLVTDPFTTTRSTRNVGLGIPLFKQMVLQAGGEFTIDSEKGEFTKLVANMERDSIDLVPIGNIADTLYLLFTNAYDCNVFYSHFVDDKKYEVSRNELLAIVGDDIQSDYETIMWIKSFIKENERELYQ